jgi:N-acetylglucosaminyl-diphospho-decaprenol L-rhamnosyltransferase
MSAISVITVTHNSSAVLEKFLDAVTTGMTADDEVIIVDSGSSDLAEIRLIANRYRTHLVTIPENIGYGAGSNRGSKIARSSWLAIVNPDVSVSMDELRVLAKQANESNIQCIGPRIAGLDGESVHTARSAISLPWRWSRHVVSRQGNLTISESISGSCMVIAADWFAKLRGFDEYFFMFCEEIDFHTRLRRAGGRVASSASVEVVTAGGGSSSTASRRWAVTERSVAHVRYVRKHFTAIEARIDLLWRYLQILRGGEFIPRSISLMQLRSGVWQVRPNNQIAEE